MKMPSILAALALSTSAFAAGPDVKATANTLVNQCASIKTGDRVLITGRAADLELLEEVAINVRKLGAFPIISVGDSKLSRRMYDETPAKFDSQANDFDLKLAGITSAMINVDAVENPGLFADVPPARAAAMAAARLPVFTEMLKNNVRQVSLGNGLYPTAATAKMYGVTQDQLSNIFWAGVNTDYSKLQNTGQSIQAALAKGKEVHITSKNGTDIKFNLNSSPAFVSDGVISADDLAKGGAALQIWLPAGEVYAPAANSSAEGTIVVDQLFYQGKEVNGTTLTFKAGKLTSLTCKSGGEAYKAAYDAAGPGKELFSLIDIGINPDVKIPEGSKLQSWVPAGMVTLGHGNNQWAGGTNGGGYEANYRLPGSTVTIDGKTIVKDGKLAQ